MPTCRYVRYDGRIATYKMLGGCLYLDSPGGQRSRVLSFCLDDPDQGPVVAVPIFNISRLGSEE